MMMDRTVNFELNNILHINGYPLDTADLLPETLHQIVEENEALLQSHLNLLQHNVEAVTQQPARISPAILIARLANLSSIGDVLTFDAVSSGSHLFTNIGALQEDVFPYWHAVRVGKFMPEVQRIAHPSPRISGAWLGIHAPTKPTS